MIHCGKFQLKFRRLCWTLEKDCLSDFSFHQVASAAFI